MYIYRKRFQENVVRIEHGRFSLRIEEELATLSIYSFLLLLELYSSYRFEQSYVNSDIVYTSRRIPWTSNWII